MSQILTPGERQSAWQTVGDHDRRIRALEAVPADEGCCCDSSGSAYRETILSTPSLWAFWPMDDADGTDELHNLVDATYPLLVEESLPSYPLVYELPGPMDGEFGIFFDGLDTSIITGSGSYSAVDTPSLLGTINPFSYECWAYPTSAADYGYLCTYGSLSNRQWGIRVGGAVGTDLELVGLRGGVTFSTGYTLALNTWHHVVFTYDGVDAKLYAQGAEVGSMASGSATDVGDILFEPSSPNQSPGQTAIYFTGRKSLVSFYTAALDAEVVADHFFSDGSPAAAGTVQTADGDGGCEFVYPTFGVYEDGA